MSGNLEMLGQIVTHTPVWVWVLLAVLIAIGAQAMRRRVVAPRRLLIAPTIFIVWGLVSLVTKPHFSALLAADWIAAGLAGVALGWSATRLKGLAVDRATGLVHMPGSPALLIRIVTVFVVKYVFGAISAISPDMLERLAPWDVAVSGLMAGFFLGFLLRFRARYRAAPEVGDAPALAGAAG